MFRTDEWIDSAWAGGALIQDKLFAYGLVSYGKTDRTPGGTVRRPTAASDDRRTRPGC